MLPLVKSMVTPLLGTSCAVKLALNHRKLPAGTKVPLKFEELVAVATQGGGVDVGQLRVFGVKVMSTGPLSPTVTVPDAETLPVNAPTLVVTFPVKLPFWSTAIGNEPVDVWPFIVTL